MNSCGIDDSYHLNLDELPSTLESDLYEGIAGHVLWMSRINKTSSYCIVNIYLDSFVRLVHELEQFVDNSLQESPVGSQETWILADDVHNVGRDYCLVEYVEIKTQHYKTIFTLLSLPFFCSHNPNRSFITVTKNLFSS